MMSPAEIDVLRLYGVTAQELETIRNSERKFKLMDDLERKHPGFSAALAKAHFDSIKNKEDSKEPEPKPVTRIR